MQSYSLFEINEFIKRVLALNFPDALWVRCEIAQVKEARGHFFIDLVQKEEAGDSIIAQAQAVLWNRQYRNIQKKTDLELNALLQEGMEVLVLAKVDFNERYGLKLVMEDFDPAYTMGRLELKRREIIRRLKELKLLEKNKALPLPPVLQRVAVLSSETAAGLQDFLQHLKADSFGYQFDCQLFPTSVQGVYVEMEMLAQLEKIEKHPAGFDCVAIIRGGGAKLDLSAFDSFELCKKVANFPLPVFTGIGHDMDETVLDLVAHLALKTPTAVADFLVQRNLAFETQVINLGENVKTLARYFLNRASLLLHHLQQTVQFQGKNQLNQQQRMLEYIAKELPGILKNYFQKEKLHLDTLENTSKLLSPQTALRRGFSITLSNGNVVTAASSLSQGDEVETRLLQGSFKSIVKKISDE